MRLIDTHAHLDFEQYDKDRDEVLKRAGEVGVEKIFNIGADIESSRRSVKLAEKYDNIYAVVGIHPHDADTLNTESLAEIKALALNNKVKAIGETGLDFYYNNSPREKQKEAFEKHLYLAKELDLPVVIHSRSAGNETLNVIDQVADFSADLIFHCYAYGPELIEKIIERDYYAAFGGLITFNSAEEIRKALEKMPLNRILLETDSPYLTPSPNRGKRNEPSYLQYILKKAAEIKKIAPEELAEITSENAEKIYKI